MTDYVLINVILLCALAFVHLCFIGSWIDYAQGQWEKWGDAEYIVFVGSNFIVLGYWLAPFVL